MLRPAYTRLLLAVVWGLVPPLLHAQMEHFPDGVYLSREQLRAHTPALQADLQIEMRTNSDIKFNGGNDYRLLSPDGSLKKKFLKKKVYAYVKNDMLLVNGLPLRVQPWFVLALNRSGDFVAFQGGISDDEATLKAMSFMLVGGAVGGAIGGGIAWASIAMERFPYMLNLRTGSVQPLSPDYLKVCFDEADLIDLLLEYQEEEEPEQMDTMVRYVQRLNEALAPGR